MPILEIIGWAATTVALVGVWLNNKKFRVCFIFWLASNAVAFGLHAWVGMWAMAARDGAFFIMAIHGWRLWGKKTDKTEVSENDNTQSAGCRG